MPPARSSSSPTSAPAHSAAGSVVDSDEHAQRLVGGEVGADRVELGERRPSRARCACSGRSSRTIAIVPAALEQDVRDTARSLAAAQRRPERVVTRSTGADASRLRAAGGAAGRRCCSCSRSYFLPAGEQIAPVIRDEPLWELPAERELDRRATSRRCGCRSRCAATASPRPTCCSTGWPTNCAPATRSWPGCASAASGARAGVRAARTGRRSPRVRR